MSTKILLQKATRIEGNASIHIEVSDGRVQTARLMVQDFRGFEKLTHGKMVESVPHIVSRICGLCSTAHQVASLRAIEGALGIEGPSSVRRLREIAVWGEWIASHALSYFFLTLPDALGAGRGIFDLLQENPEAAHDAFFLRKSGNRIVEIIGKRPVHAVALGVGRFNLWPTAEDLAETRRIAAEIKDKATKLIANLDDDYQREVHIPFPAEHSVNFLSYGGESGEERFRAVDKAGELKEEFDRESFSDHIAEMRVDWSLAKFPYLSGAGFPDGILLVGPLSRRFMPGGVLDEPELAGFELTQTLRDSAALYLDYLDECRLLEIYWASKQILNHLDNIDMTDMEADAVDLEGSGRGIGVVEAPRGVLVHNYLVNRGTIEKMRLLVATQFNNAYINLVLRDLAETYVNGNGLSGKGERIVARCVRVFDPCLTCATH